MTVDPIARFLVLIVTLRLLAAPLAAGAEQAAKLPRIGVLCPTQCVPTNPVFLPWIQGLQDHGWIDGQNVIIDYRHARGDAEQLPKLAAELVAAKPDVLGAPSPAAASALKAATRTIPIVFAGIFNPVESGFVASLARPGGNMTGITASAGPELEAKRLELLQEALPKASHFVILTTPANEPYTTKALETLDVAARALRVKLRQVDVQTPEDLEPVFASLAADRLAALLVLASPLTFAQATRIGDLATQYRLPTMAPQGLTPAGYLMSYAPDFADIFRRHADYINKVLKGAKPADLPVEQPTKRDELVSRTYRPLRNRRVEIPKGEGKVRVLGIPPIRDRVVQGALKHILEPIFEADFHEGSYGYRPKRTAQQAVDRVAEAIVRNKTRVIDLDLASYLDAATYCPPIHGALWKSSGCSVTTLIRKPLRRPWRTWTASSSPRFTRCNTVCRETPSRSRASSIGM